MFYNLFLCRFMMLFRVWYLQPSFFFIVLKKNSLDIPQKFIFSVQQEKDFKRNIKNDMRMGKWHFFLSIITEALRQTWRTLGANNWSKTKKRWEWIINCKREIIYDANVMQIIHMGVLLSKSMSYNYQYSINCTAIIQRPTR